MNQRIKQLMLEAIEYQRPQIIAPFMLPIWNQPFFYKIDKAEALTISYNPTDKGAKNNYPQLVEEYKRKGHIESERIFDLLYNFKKEIYWRRTYDIIFTELGIETDKIAHMDVSSYPYKSLSICKEFYNIDESKKYLLQCINLLKDQLKYIFIDGKNNKSILSLLCNQFELKKIDFLPVNNKKCNFELLIFKHRDRDLYMIYYGCQLYGATSPSDVHVKKIANFIKENTFE